MKTYEEREAKLRELITDEELVQELIEMGFLTCPASTKYHGAYEGGLFDHSVAVAEQLEEMTHKFGLEWQDERSPTMIGLLHDVCKLDSYTSDPYAHIPSYLYKTPNEQKYPIGGHGIKSIVMIQDIFNRCLISHLNHEEILCIRYHMGAYEEGAWSDFDAAIKQHPNVLWTHHADMVASKILGV